MARLSDRLPQNVEGDLYVDSSCIDCDTCRRLSPRTFRRDDRGEVSYVWHQPEDEGARERSLLALVACPTSSIGTVSKADVSRAARAFPLDFDEGVSFCGYTAESSFGAWSWLVRRPGGNVLVDSPRAAELLLSRIEEMGSVRWMFLTHRDDVADHAVIARRFGATRVLHADDVTPATRDVERVIEGTDPVELADGLLAIPVPGHTKGSAALLVEERDLFTGDHLWARNDGRDLGASRSVCWYSWPEQIRSIERLLELPFRRVFPGHGPVFEAPSPAEAHDALRRLLSRTRAG